MAKSNEKEREDPVIEIRVLASVEYAMVVRYYDHAFIENDKLWIITELLVTLETA